MPIFRSWVHALHGPPEGLLAGRLAAPLLRHQDVEMVIAELASAATCFSQDRTGEEPRRRGMQRGRGASAIDGCCDQAPAAALSHIKLKRPRRVE